MDNQGWKNWRESAIFVFMVQEQAIVFILNKSGAENSFGGIAAALHPASRPCQQRKTTCPSALVLQLWPRWHRGHWDVIAPEAPEHPSPQLGACR